MVSAIPDTETCQNTERHELQLRSGVLLRPHRSTTYVDVAYCYRPSSVVCWSVCLSDCRSVSYTSEPSKNSWTDRDAVWVMDLGGPREPCIRWGPDPPMGRGNFEGERGVPLWSIGTLCGELRKNGWTDRDAFWVMGSNGHKEMNHVFDGSPECWGTLPWQPVLGCNLP